MRGGPFSPYVGIVVEGACAQRAAGIESGWCLRSQNRALALSQTKMSRQRHDSKHAVGVLP